MTKRKLKGYVMPTVYMLTIGAVVISVILIGRAMKQLNDKNVNPVQTYVVNAIIEENITPVNEEITKDKVIKPFTSEDVIVKKEFYEKDASEEKQQKSLIFYEGTYMQNSGILYTSKKEFDIVAAMDGTVSNIKEDNLLGMVVEIEHNSKLTTVYQSLKETNLTVGATVKQGELIGKSGPNKIDTSSNNALLFEVFHNGNLINPNTYFGSDIKDFNE